MSIFGQADSLARMSQWRGKGEDYTENELACFLSLFDSSENEVTINPDQELGEHLVKNNLFVVPEDMKSFVDYNKVGQL